MQVVTNGFQKNDVAKQMSITHESMDITACQNDGACGEVVAQIEEDEVTTPMKIVERCTGPSSFKEQRELVVGQFNGLKGDKGNVAAEGFRLIETQVQLVKKEVTLTLEEKYQEERRIGVLSAESTIAKPVIVNGGARRVLFRDDSGWHKKLDSTPHVVEVPSGEGAGNLMALTLSKEGPYEGSLIEGLERLSLKRRVDAEDWELSKAKRFKEEQS